MQKFKHKIKRCSMGCIYLTKSINMYVHFLNKRSFFIEKFVVVLGFIKNQVTKLRYFSQVLRGKKYWNLIKQTTIDV